MTVDQSVRRWPVQDAKARFSELLEASLSEGPQIVTRRGIETAVLVPFEEWQAGLRVFVVFGLRAL